MTTASTRTDSHRKTPLRLWPGVLAAALMLLLRFVGPAASPDLGPVGVLAGVAGGLVILVWWLFFSRAAWIERVGAVLLILLAGFITRLLAHPSISGGMMGLMLPVYAIPVTLGPLLVAWAVATRHQSTTFRRTTMVVAIALGCGVWVVARTDGIRGESGAQLAWRWTPTPEERLLARPETALPPAIAVTPSAAPTPVALPTTEAPAVVSGAAAEAPSAPESRRDPLPLAPAAWPGFRGPQRNGAAGTLMIQTDWAASPPVQIWRRPVGPAWSSFAVDGEFVYTQEQRGENEIVSSYRLSTGEPVWAHRDEARFYESNGGPGPRATPTVHNGRVYTLGATGIVNALDARSGRPLWARNAESDTGATRPGWGYAGSPVVVEGMVIVAASGRLAAYDAASGERRWTRITGGGGYSSPHLATIDGVAQILLPNGAGITSVSPSDGAILWESKGTGDGVGIVQPAVIGERDVLVAAADMMGGTGIRRLGVSRQDGRWTVEERWSSRGLKPYFNDFVVHEGHAYGFDGTILSCIDLARGERKWKGGRYGAGQMLLLPEQDLLLVLSEEGELALVSATGDRYAEVARFKAIEGKTWNHPVVVGDVILVRNGEEMASFRLARLQSNGGTRR